MNLELWQILGNQAFDDAFYADMLQCLSFAHNDTATLVLCDSDESMAEFYETRLKPAL